jgi:hypothetical protein
MTIKWIAHFSAAALITIACLGTCEAAEKIRYEEIPNRLGPFDSVLAYRGFRVVTLDGKTHSGRRLRLEWDHVRIFHRNNTWEDLPGKQIARIEISQGGRFFHKIVDGVEAALLIPALACSESDSTVGCMVGASALLSPLIAPIWAYSAVTAPFYLAADGVAFLVPPKVYEIVH